MKKEIIARVNEIADYIIETKNTIREAAVIFQVSKSTAHKDLHDRLKEINLSKYNQINNIMQHHIDIRHLRGGESTKQKYSLKRA